MKLKIVFMCSILMIVYANVDNDFILDFFNYKRLTKIISFSCNSVQDDLVLMRKFNQRGIVLSINKLDAAKILHQTDIKYWKLGVFIDIRCYDLSSITSVFFQASNYRLFGELHHWLLLSSNLDESLQLIDDGSFGPSTDFVIAVSLGSDEYELYDVYNLLKERGTNLNVTFYGSWNKNEGLVVDLTQPKISRRSDLQGVELRASFFRSGYRPKYIPLEIYYKDFAHRTIDGASKCGYHILSHLSDIYNFSLKPLQAPIWVKGDPIGPVAQDLVHNRADFTGTALVITMKRSYHVRSVHQTWPFRTCFIFRNPQPTTIKVREIFRPFAYKVWYLLIMTVLLGLIVLAVNLKFEGIDSGYIFRLSHSFLMTVGALCQQCTDTKMDQVSTRLTFLSIMIFGLLMYNYYSSTVVSARLDEPIYKINDSLNELGKLKLKISSEWMDYVDYFLKRPDWDALTFYSNYWTKLSEAERFMPPNIGMKLVQKGGFAYHTHPHVGYPFIEKMYSNREICELMEVNVARPMQTSFGLKWNSTLVEISRIGFTKISEVGLRRRQVMRWSHRKPVCRRDILSASSVNMNEFAPHLILLIIGIMVAIFMCVLEIIFNRYGSYYVSKFSGLRRCLRMNYYGFQNDCT